MAFCLLAQPVLANPINHCVNISNALEAPREGSWGYSVKDQHLIKIAEAGFDTIRLPVRFDAYFDTKLDPVFLARVDHVIRTALEADLQVILDLHHFKDVIEDVENHADKFLQIWTELSKHYRGWPDGLMFELLNEPTRVIETKRVDQLFDSVWDVIRENHPERWIIVEGAKYSSINEIAKLKLRDDKTIYSFHYYQPFKFTHQGASWMDKPPPPNNLEQKDVIRLQNKIAQSPMPDGPILLGEFGALHTIEAPQRNRWITAVRKAAEKRGFGWCYWGFAAGFGLFDPQIESWRQDMLDALFAD